MADKIALPNGCSMSKPSVNPKNWATGGRELLKINWQVQFYFYDPEFKNTHPYGKLIAVRGMNDFKTLKDRRKMTQLIIDQEIAACLEGYNHFTKSIIGETEFDYEIEPTTGFINALKKACTLLNVCEATRKGVENTIRHIERTAKQLRIHERPISEIQRRNVKACLDYVERNAKEESNYRYNRNRAHLLMLFKELVEYETIDQNVVRDISKRVVEKKQRQILTPEEFERVRNYLEENCEEFYRYVMIFFFSGSRSTELYSVQKKHVNLDKREYQILIKKGKQYVWETKAIILPAIPFWKEIIEMCKSDDDYLFSDKFLPGKTQAKNKKSTTYWNKHVKKKLKIKADFYTLKHLFLDLLDKQNNSEMDVAKGMAAHRSSAITDIYRVGKQKRELEVLKQINVKL